MHLVEIFLPARDNEKRPFDARKFADVREKLTDRFGGVTSFIRAPAQGVNVSGGGSSKLLARSCIGFILGNGNAELVGHACRTYWATTRPHRLIDDDAIHSLLLGEHHHGVVDFSRYFPVAGERLIGPCPPSIKSVSRHHKSSRRPL
jgi:hypothetical protein